MNYRNVFLSILCYCISISNVFSQSGIEIPIWPDGAAESNGITDPEKNDNNFWLHNISTASMCIYPADPAKNTGKVILICPGGGYAGEAIKHEGRDFALWYAQNGITGIVMKYRLPNGHDDIPLKDVQEAMRIIRKRSAEWGIDPQQVGISGFSAGGHLASTLLTHFDETCRPDFGILFYPVISLDGEKNPHIGSRKNLLGNNDTNQQLIDYYSNEKQIRNNTPPTLLLLSDDDTVVIPENSILFYRGLKAKNIPACLYIFPEGGHGWGFNTNFRYHEEMKSLLLNWLFPDKLPFVNR